MTLASCDSRKTAGENPFFTEWDTPHGVPPFDKILPEHFMPAFERGMSLHEAEIDAITSNKDEATFENTILAYDNAGQMLAQTELVFGMLCAAETNDRMQALQEQAMPLLAAHRDKIRLDDKLFVRVKEVYDRRAALGLDAEQMRLLQREQNEEESLEVMKNRWEEWEEKARKRLKDGEEKIQISKKELDRATQSLQKFLQEENRKKGQLEEVQRQCEIFKEQEKEKRTAYEAMRSEQQFETEEDFQNACMKSAELERREKVLEAYEEQLRQSRQEVDWLRQQLKGKETPDLAQTESELKEQKEQQRMQERELRKLYSRRETNQQAARKLQQLTKEREELRKRYQVLNTLSRTANGSLAGTAKIDLESYMQRQYFQQMIRCANRHLERMAAGQFLLKCRSLENLSTQGNAGLDLDVYSLITGKVRDVKTLSGGESFMAALALALGMTDVITQAVGAVHIDTLFIDEGFGSLDENAREQAIRILQGLSGGSRLVGIISHVTELKEQIEQKLVVTKGKSGSKVEWK